MTTEEFIEKVKQNNRHNLKVKGEFIDLQTPILTECLDHEIEWSPCKEIVGWLRMSHM